MHHPWDNEGMERGASRPIVTTSALLLALLAAHDVSHVVDEGLDTTLGQLALVSTPQWIVIGAVMAVILRAESTRATTAAFLLGAGTVVGFALVHLLPFAVASYWDLDPTFLSWVVAWVPTAVGVVLALISWPGARALLRPGRRPAVAG